MNSGTIIFFDNRPDKKFGFIRPDGVKWDEASKNVFFHGSAYCKFVCDGRDKPGISGMVAESDICRGKRVVFDSKQGTKGPRAEVFGDEATYQQAVQQCESRPTYRLVERTGRVHASRLSRAPGEPPAKYRTLWQGRNLTEMLGRHVDTYDGEHIARYFEVLNNEQWTQCEDPRK